MKPRKLLSQNLFSATIALTLGALAVLSGCSTAKVRVLRGEDGTNRVIARDIEHDDAEEAAYKAAENYCKDQNKHAVYVQENSTKYTGSMNENTRKTVRNASKAAMILSPVAGVGAQSAGLGTAVGAAGTAGYAMTSDRDYSSELKFKCE
jgi:hypothetical protein